MTEGAPEREYEVGYGKPPVASRFPPGRSGNPRGRQKGSKNGRTLLEIGDRNPGRADREQQASQDDQARDSSSSSAVNKAATTGDVKDFIALAKHYGSDETDPKTGNDEPTLEGEDAETYESFLKRVKGGV